MGKTVSVVFVDNNPQSSDNILRCIKKFNPLIASDEKDLRHQLRQKEGYIPDVLLVWLLKERDFSTIVRAMNSSSQSFQIVVVVKERNIQQIVDALEEGACGYIFFDTSPKEFEEAIQRAAGRYAKISHSEIAEEMERRLSKNSLYPLPSPRKEILSYLAAGKTIEEISTLLALKEQVIEGQIFNIIATLQKI